MHLFQFSVQQSFRASGSTFTENNQALAEFLSHVSSHANVYFTSNSPHTSLYKVEDLLSDIEHIHDITEKIARNHAIILASFDNNGRNSAWLYPYIGRIITYLLYNFIITKIDIVIINMGREKGPHVFIL